MVGNKVLGVHFKSFLVGFSTCALVALYLNHSVWDTSLKQGHASRDQRSDLQNEFDVGQLFVLPSRPVATTTYNSHDLPVQTSSMVILRSASASLIETPLKTIATTTSTVNVSTLAATPTVIMHTNVASVNTSSTSSTSMSRKKRTGPRILCWIMTHYSNLMTKAVHVHDTWGQRCDKILYFISNGTDPSPANETRKLIYETSEKPNVNDTNSEQVNYMEQTSKQIPQEREMNGDHGNKSDHESKSFSSDKNSTDNDYASSNRTLPIVILDEIPEGRMHLMAKSNHAFDYIFKHHINEFDWFLKADDDTYVVMENLRHFLSHSDTNTPVYFGHHFKNLYIESGYNSGGSGYVFSKEALRRFGKYHKSSKECKIDGEDEDVGIGQCLEHLGVRVGKTSDEHEAVRFVCFSLEQRLMGKLPFWNKLVEAYSTEKGLKSISSDVISFHYIEPWMMYALEYFVYKFKLRPEEL